MNEERIPITRPVLGEREAGAAGRAILSGWVTQGPEVRAFQAEFAGLVGSEHACAVSSCTTALHLALLVVGVEPGDEVITASHSYIATANSVRYCGATPVFVDIEPETFNLDASKIEEAIGPRTKAILCVHQMGMPCDIGAIVDIARRRGLMVVEDSACAIGSEILADGRWEKIGRPHGDLACFSFHPRKVLTTGDGGMITTSSADWDRRLRLLRQHGMSVPDTVRHEANRVVLESYPLLGFNYRMTDIQAAVGREQLARLPEIVATRRRLADRYVKLLGDLGGVGLPLEPPWARSNWQSYCIRLPEGREQQAVMQSMLDAGVSTRRGIMCSHREPAYEDQPWRCGSVPASTAAAAEILRHSEEAQERTILLPLFPQMTDAEQERVAEALRRACDL